ncbi:MAG: IS110 family transposase [Anaerolineales bacterium]
MICVGIDWADEKHDVCIRDLEDRRILSEFEITNDAEGVAKFEELVSVFGYARSEIPVAIEKPDGLLVGYLLQQGYVVYAINPKSVDRYRDRLHVAGSKTDKDDAAVLADILCVDRDYHDPIPDDSALAKEIKAVSRNRQRLVKERTRIENQLTACLKKYYPAVLTLFTDLNSSISRAFLCKYPNGRVAEQASLEDLKEFFDEQGYTWMRKVPRIYEQLQAPRIPIPDWQVRTQQQLMLSLVEMLSAVVRQIREYEERITELLEKHEDAFIFRSLPNAADVTAAWILGEIGDCREKFETSSGMQALAGSCPVTKQSSGTRYVEFRTACCKSFRNAMQQFARNSTLGKGASSWARGYLSSQLERGHSMSRATRALANRWLSIIFRLWKDRVVYDEKVHLRNRAQHGLKNPA